MRKAQLFLLSSILCISLLTGCGPRETVSVTTIPPTTETIPVETTPPATFATASTDVLARLADTEAKYAVLQDRLMLDGSLTQADMNELAGQEYTLWDTLLNDLWAELTHTLPEKQMQQLLEEERAWIRWKENSIAMITNYYDGGSLSILAGNFRAAILTRDRVYELAEILSTGQYPTTLDFYAQVFLPLASQNQRPTYENLLLFLDFRGLTLHEEEGTFQITSSSTSDEYLFGLLSNEEDIVTVPQLGYCTGDGTSRRSVRLDFYAESTDHYIEAFTWDDGTLVSTTQEMTDYLRSP